MSRQGYSERFFELARLLVTTTKARHDAESIVQFLLRHDRTDDVATVLGDVPELIETSPLLRSAQAWTAYRAGDIAQATAVLTGLRAERDVADDRALLTNILITSGRWRSEEHTSELQSLMRISYAVFCLQKKNTHYLLFFIIYFQL